MREAESTSLKCDKCGKSYSNIASLGKAVTGTPCQCQFFRGIRISRHFQMLEINIFLNFCKITTGTG
jgi:hypothetical protein